MEPRSKRAPRQLYVHPRRGTQPQPIAAASAAACDASAPSTPDPEPRHHKQAATPPQEQEGPRFETSQIPQISPSEPSQAELSAPSCAQTLNSRGDAVATSTRPSNLQEEDSFEGKLSLGFSELSIYHRSPSGDEPDENDSRSDATVARLSMDEIIQTCTLLVTDVPLGLPDYAIDNITDPFVRAGGEIRWLSPSQSEFLAVYPTRTKAEAALKGRYNTLLRVKLLCNVSAEKRAKLLGEAQVAYERIERPATDAQAATRMIRNSLGIRGRAKPAQPSRSKAPVKQIRGSAWSDDES